MLGWKYLTLQRWPGTLGPLWVELKSSDALSTELPISIPMATLHESIGYQYIVRTSDIPMGICHVFQLVYKHISLPHTHDIHPYTLPAHVALTYHTHIHVTHTQHLLVWWLIVPPCHEGTQLGKKKAIRSCLLQLVLKNWPIGLTKIKQKNLKW